MRARTWPRERASSALAARSSSMSGRPAGASVTVQRPPSESFTKPSTGGTTARSGVPVSASATLRSRSRRMPAAVEAGDWTVTRRPSSPTTPATSRSSAGTAIGVVRTGTSPGTAAAARAAREYELRCTRPPYPPSPGPTRRRRRLARMPTLRGPHLRTPLTLLTSDRDALLRGEEGILAPGEDARYLVTRSGAVALSEEADGTLRAALETADPRSGSTQPLVLLGRRDGLRVLGVELGEGSAELDDPGRDLRDLRHVADLLDETDADLAAAAVAMGAWHRSMRHCPLCGGLLEPELGGWVLRCREDGIEQFPRTDPAVIMAVRD